MKVVRRNDTRVFLEGSEVCREYYATAKRVFGTSTLAPAITGAIDIGHPDGEEIFCVMQGEVLLRNPDNGEGVVLNTHDIAIIPKGEPHQLTNCGETTAIVSWCLANDVKEA